MEEIQKFSYSFTWNTTGVDHSTLKSTQYRKKYRHWRTFHYNYSTNTPLYSNTGHAGYITGLCLKERNSHKSLFTAQTEITQNIQVHMSTNSQHFPSIPVSLVSHGTGFLKCIMQKKILLLLTPPPHDTSITYIIQ